MLHKSENLSLDPQKPHKSNAVAYIHYPSAPTRDRKLRKKTREVPQPARAQHTQRYTRPHLKRGGENQHLSLSSDLHKCAVTPIQVIRHSNMHTCLHIKDERVIIPKFTEVRAIVSSCLLCFNNEEGIGEVKTALWGFQ